LIPVGTSKSELLGIPRRRHDGEKFVRKSELISTWRREWHSNCGTFWKDTRMYSLGIRESLDVAP
jgi:hypothetical protein